MKKKIVIIVGQTGTGKSKVAVKLAGQFGCEIISADSMQVYKYMNIGTAKLANSERKTILHHLIDIVTPDDEYNAFRFLRDAKAKIDEIFSRKNYPLVVGGTGLYIRCLLGGMFEFKKDTSKAREKLSHDLKNRGLYSLYEDLKSIDPEAASDIKPADKQRIIRALEVFHSSGKKISQLQNAHKFKEKSFTSIKIGLAIERDVLLEKIRQRVELMFRNGLLEEVESLINKGYKGDLKALNSIGYREALEVIEGSKTVEEAIEATIKRTKDYAKRQTTWFRKDREIKWFHPENDMAKIEQAIKNFLGD